MIDVTEKPIRLVDAGADREALAAFRIFSSSVGGEILKRFGLVWPGYWCLLRVPLNGGRGLQGEIDVIAGRLAPVPTPVISPKLQANPQQFNDHPFLAAAADGRTLIPWSVQTEITLDLSYLVAIEVKCSYVETATAIAGRWPEIKSTKAGSGKIAILKKQLRRALSLGCDSVGLLDVVAGPPIATQSLPGVLQSFSVATSAVDRNVHGAFLQACSDLPVGYCRLVVSPTLVGDEAEAGAYRFGFKKEPEPNSGLNDPRVQALREYLLNQINSILRSALNNNAINGGPLVVDVTPDGQFRTNQTPIPNRARQLPSPDEPVLFCNEGVQVGPGEIFGVIAPGGIPIGKKENGS